MSRSFYAIRRCDFLRAPALFFGFEDCSFYIDGYKGGDNAEKNETEYGVFEEVEKALEYLLKGTSTTNPVRKEQQQQKRKTTTTKKTTTTTTTTTRLFTNTSSSSSSSTTASTITSAETQKRPSSPTSSNDENGKTTAQSSVGTPNTNAQRNVAKSTPTDDATPTLMANRITTTTSTSTTSTTNAEAVRPKKKQRTQEIDSDDAVIISRTTAPTKEKTTKEANDQTKERKILDIVPKATTSADGVTEDTSLTARQIRQRERQKQQYDAVWDENLALLKEYMIEHGDTDVPHPRSGKLDARYVGLSKWVRRTREELRRFRDGKRRPEDSVFFLRPERVDILTGLGLRAGTSSRASTGSASSSSAPRDPEEEKEEFERMLVALQDTLQEKRAIRSTNRLQGWIVRQRREYEAFVKGDTETTMTEDRVKRFLATGYSLETRKSCSWDERAQQLFNYMETHNGAEPRRHDGGDNGLGKWVSDQRTKYKARTQGKPTNLTDDQIRKLADRGFNWTTRPKKEAVVDPVEDAAEFDRMVVLLHETISTKTPLRHNHRLQGWVARQRREYAEFKNGSTTSTMTEDRIARFIKTGCSLEAKKTFTWDERALQWFEYKTKHGVDPKRYDEDGLGKWCGVQRARYNLKKEGKKSILTDEQIKRLTNWGFSWEFKIKQPEYRSPCKSWDERFQELVRYKEENGDCLVPQHYPELGNWVHSTRTNYHNFKKGLKSVLTDERIERLKSVGFVFNTRHRTVKRERERERERDADEAHLRSFKHETTTTTNTVTAMTTTNNNNNDNNSNRDDGENAEQQHQQQNHNDNDEGRHHQQQQHHGYNNNHLNHDVVNRLQHQQQQQHHVHGGYGSSGHNLNQDDGTRRQTYVFSGGVNVNVNHHPNNGNNSNTNQMYYDPQQQLQTFHSTWDDYHV